MREKLIIPAVILLALASYDVILACSGRMFNAFKGTGRWVYRDEQPSLFWACTLAHAIGFATMLFLLYNDMFNNGNFAAKVTAVATGFALGGVIFFWGRKQ